MNVTMLDIEIDRQEPIDLLEQVDTVLSQQGYRADELVKIIESVG